MTDRRVITTVHQFGLFYVRSHLFKLVAIDASPRVARSVQFQPCVLVFSLVRLAKKVEETNLEAIAGTELGLLLGTDGDGELGVLGALGAEDEARGRAREREEGVHGLAPAESLSGLLEELLLLIRVARLGLDAVDVPAAGGGFHVAEVEVDGLVAVLGVGLDGAVYEVGEREWGGEGQQIGKNRT